MIRFMNYFIFVLLSYQCLFQLCFTSYSIYIGQESEPLANGTIKNPFPLLESAFNYQINLNESEISLIFLSSNISYICNNVYEVQKTIILK